MICTGFPACTFHPYRVFLFPRVGPDTWFLADAQCHTVDLERLLFTRMIVRLGRLPAEMLIYFFLYIYIYNMPILPTTKGSEAFCLGLNFLGSKLVFLSD